MSDVQKVRNYTNDRATVFLSRKYNVAKFESLDINVGMSTDAQPGESEKECFARVEEVVTAQFMRICKEAKKLA